MTVLSIPSMIFYVSGNVNIPADFKNIINALSLGNIGGSKYACDNSNSQLLGSATDY